MHKYSAIAHIHSSLSINQYYDETTPKPHYDSRLQI